MATVLSIATLAVVLWVWRVLMPRAAAQDGRFALVCTLLTLLLALGPWLLVGATPIG